jgi:branched-chain amino acid transport system permease protein
VAAELTPVQQRRLEESRSRLTRPTVFIQAAVFVCLLLLPWVWPSFRVMDVAAKVMIFAVAVASFDIILGYTGIISFAHGMFFGLGAYSVALICYHTEAPQYYHLVLAAALAVLISAVIAALIAAFSLRVKAIFFAMMTLAVAEFAHILGYQWSSLTMGEDGVSFKLPGIFLADWSAGQILGTPINGRLMVYYLTLAASIVLFVGVLRFVRSPAGRVLKSIRDNEQRSTALGFKVFHYRILSTIFGSVISSLAGVLFAMWLSYVNPDTVLGTPLMLNILLMVIIGGLGTVYGGIVGAAFITITETWLPDLLKAGAGLLPKVEILQRVADRWVLFFGLAYVLVVLFFPKGVMGSVRDYIAQRQAGNAQANQP